MSVRAPRSNGLRLQRLEDWAAKPRGGSTSPLEKHANFLLTLIERQSDLTLDEVVCVLRKQGIRSSRTSVWRFFKRHNITFKKTLHAAEQQRADVDTARRRWMRAQGMFDPAHLVFLDETAANTKMMRVGGRCLRGERLDRPGSARPLENDNLRRRFTLQGNDSAICN